MKTETKTKIQNSVVRAVVTFLSLVLQIWWISVLMIYLYNYSEIIEIVTRIVTLAVAVMIFNKENSPIEFKAPLIMLILALPIVGLCMFLLIERKGMTRRMRARFKEIHEEKKGHLHQEESVIHELEGMDPGIANQFRYLSKAEGFPVFSDSDVSFYSDAAEAYRVLLDTVKTAEEFIFLEYHAIEDSIAFQELKTILQEKVQNGIEVRIMYDDVGSIGFLNGRFKKKMEEIGIQCRVFNRISPIFRLFMNNRDHRKMTVVDGRVAFTGGYNLADEYFGITKPYGEWKDTGIKITGNAVNSMTEMFLAMWNSSEDLPEDFSRYYRTVSSEKAVNSEQASSPKQVDSSERVSSSKQTFSSEPTRRYEQTVSYIQPYADNPLDDAYVGENAYMNMIKQAASTLYVTTPYLVLGQSMKRELTLAAARGVDVRIVTPGIPDKKLVFRVTRSYYEGLVKHGVRIFEYTPGFLHSKQMIADRKTAIVGTINMDYRSFYHHFENGVLMYHTDAIEDIFDDFQHLFDVSQEVTEAYRGKRKNRLIVLDCLLRLLAPLF